jgi:hypothetical protein
MAAPGVSTLEQERLSAILSRVYRSDGLSAPRAKSAIPWAGPGTLVSVGTAF